MTGTRAARSAGSRPPNSPIPKAHATPIAVSEGGDRELNTVAQGAGRETIEKGPCQPAFASLPRAAAARYNYAMNTSLFDQVRQLSVEEQIELVEALWDNIVERNAVPGPTEAQKAELDRRLSEHAAHPDDVVPWSEVKDSALTRIRR